LLVPDPEFLTLPGVSSTEAELACSIRIRGSQVSRIHCAAAATTCRPVTGRTLVASSRSFASTGTAFWELMMTRHQITTAQHSASPASPDEKEGHAVT